LAATALQLAALLRTLDTSLGSEENQMLLKGPDELARS
jgi:hypothetical protein